MIAQMPAADHTGLIRKKYTMQSILRCKSTLAGGVLIGDRVRKYPCYDKRYLMLCQQTTKRAREHDRRHMRYSISDLVLISQLLPSLRQACNTLTEQAGILADSSFNNTKTEVVWNSLK
jgi:hypothetical protein